MSWQMSRARGWCCGNIRKEWSAFWQVYAVMLSGASTRAETCLLSQPRGRVAHIWCSFSTSSRKPHCKHTSDIHCTSKLPITSYQTSRWIASIKHSLRLSKSAEQSPLTLPRLWVTWEDLHLPLETGVRGLFNRGSDALHQLITSKWLWLVHCLLLVSSCTLLSLSLSLRSSTLGHVRQFSAWCK